MLILCDNIRWTKRKIATTSYNKTSCISCNFLVSFQSSVCEKIVEELGQHNVENGRRKIVILTLDSFYKVLDRKDLAKSLKGNYNFDHPGRRISIMLHCNNFQLHLVTFKQIVPLLFPHSPQKGKKTFVPYL